MHFRINGRSGISVDYAYVTSQVRTSLTGDPRDLALRNVLYAIIQPAERL
jgi:hypothetical protein